MKKKILLTGGTGFLGQHLLRSFDEDYQDQFNVTMLVRKKDELQADTNRDRITEEQLHSGSDSFGIYIHMAGIAHDLKGYRSVQDYEEVNTKLTIRLYERFLKDANADTFIFLSSSKAVTDESDTALTEDAICSPKTPYGKTKRAAEVYILDRIPANKRVIILRPVVIHGEGNKGNMPLLFRWVQNGLPWPLGSYDNKRSVLSIENFIFVMHQFLAGKGRSGIYHVADTVPVSVNEIVQIAAEVVEKPARILHIPKMLVSGTASIGSLISLPLDKDRLSKLTSPFILSNRKLCEELNISLPYTAQEGLRNTFQSLKRVHESAR